jgi:hypothetical protein
MNQVFFIFLAIHYPSGQHELRPLKQPYFNADVCVEAAIRILDQIKPAHPIVKGALCYTIDELGQYSQEGDLK